MSEPPAGPGSAGAELRRLAAGVRLTPTQRRVLAHLVDHDAELPWLSAGVLAGRAGVSQPSVTRLANALGFDGWTALRTSIRERAVRPPPSDGTVVDAEAAAVTRLGGGLPGPAALADLGRCLAAARPLIVAGFRASSYLAEYTAYLAGKVHPGVVALTHGGPDALDRLVAARTSGATAALIVCMPRYPAETVALLGDAAALGYRLALVTDEGMPPVPGVAVDWRIPVPVNTGLTFDAHPAAVVALGLILDAICDADPAGAERRLEALDDAAARARTYWSG